MKSFFTITTVAALACVSNAINVRQASQLVQQEQDSTYYNDQKDDHEEEHALVALTAFHDHVIEPITGFVDDGLRVFPLVIRELVLQAIADAENQSTDPMNLIIERLHKAEKITASVFRQNAGYMFAGFAYSLAGQGQMEVYNALGQEFSYMNYVYERIHSDFQDSLADSDISETELTAYYELVDRAHKGGDQDGEDYDGEDYDGKDYQNSIFTLAQGKQGEEQNSPSVAEILSATHYGVELVNELAEEVTGVWDSIIEDAFGAIGDRLSELESLDRQTLDEAMGELKMVSAQTSEIMEEELYGAGLDFVYDLFSIFEELGQPTDQARAALQEWSDENNQHHF